MSSRLYLDYNSTSPLSSKVLDFLRSGDFPFANPASSHTSGKASKKLITKTTKFLKETFSTDFEVIYHSGATEALNTFFNKAAVRVFSSVDHPAVADISKDLKSFVFDINNDGSYDYQKLEKILIESKSSLQESEKIYLNFTWVNNETGIVNDFSEIIKLKKKYDFYLHVDAVQAVGKVESWKKFPSEIDMITFSGHKFGAMKGIGFSFINPIFSLKPFVLGGGQQSGIRSGTENHLGVYSLKLALEDITSNSNYQKSVELREGIQALINKNLQEKAQFISASKMASNTIGVFFKNIKSDVCLIQFDLAGIDVSFGSACSSGNISHSQSLELLGFKDLKNHFIRISFGPYDYKNKEYILEQLDLIFKKISKI